MRYTQTPCPRCTGRLLLEQDERERFWRVFCLNCGNTVCYLSIQASTVYVEPVPVLTTRALIRGRGRGTYHLGQIA